MAKFLHLLQGDDSSTVAVPVIAENCRQAGADVTVVLLEGAPPPALPPAARVRRLAGGDLDYASLLDLIFESDHVVTW